MKAAMQTAVSLSACVAIGVGLAKHRPAAAWKFVLIGCGALSLLIAKSIFLFEGVGRHAPSVSPAVGDLFFLGAFPFFLAGLLWLIWTRDRVRDGLALTDACIFTIGATLLVWVLVVDPSLAQTHLTPAARLTSIAFPAIELALLAVAVRFALGSGSGSTAFNFLLVSFAALLVSDAVFTLTVQAGTYRPGGAIDAGWLLSNLFLGVAVLHPSIRRVGQATAVKPTSGVSRLILLAAAMLTIPVALLSESLRDDAVDVTVIIMASVLLSGLLMTRVGGTVRELIRSEGRKSAVVASSLECIVMMDGQGRILEFNPAAERTFGYQRGNVIGREMAELIIPERFRDQHRRGLARYLATGEERVIGRRVEIWALRADGTEFPVELAIARVHAADGVVFTGYIRDITERRLAETTAKELAAIVESSNDAIIGRSLDSVVTSWNAGAEHMYGYTAEEVVGRSLELLVPPEIQEDLSVLTRRIRLGERIRDYETIRMRKDGTRLAVSLTVSPIEDEAGVLVGASVIARDMTDKHAREEALRASARSGAEYQSLFDDSTAGIARSSIDGRIVAINAAFARMLAYESPDDLMAHVDHTRELLMDPTQHESISRVMHDVGSLSNREIQVRRKDGRPIWVLANAQTRLDAMGDVIGLDSIWLDITDRKEAEEQLLRHSLIFNNITDAVIVTDLQLRIIDFNPGAELLTGYSKREVLGESPDLLRFPDEPPNTVKEIEAVMRTEGRWSGEAPLRRKDGTRRVIELVIVPLRDVHEQVIATVAMIRDITERRQAEDEVRRSLERLEALHDIDQAILAANPIEETAGGALGRLRRLVSADRASLLLFDQAAGTGRFAAVDPPDAPGPATGETVLLEDLPSIETLLQNDLRISQDLSNSELLSPHVDRLLAQGIRSAVTASLISDGDVVGLIALSSTRIGGMDESNHDAIREIAHQLALVLRQARLKEEAERHTLEMEQAVSELRRVDRERRKLLTSLVTAQEEERRRIAADIHDDSIQKVTAASMRLDMLELKHPQLAADEGFLKAQNSVRRSIQSMRHLMFELRPYVLDRDGLLPAIRLYLAEESKIEGGPAYHLDGTIATEPPHEIRIVLYRVAQEALANVRKHAHAARVDVFVGERENGYLIKITDDGIGFDADQAPRSPVGHLGLNSMREHAERAGGWLRVTTQPDHGTDVEFWIPDGLAEEPETI